MIEEFIKKFKGTEEQLNQIKGLLLEYKKFELEYVKEFDTKNITKILTKKLKDSYILEKEEGFELVEGYTILKISNEKKR